MKAAVLIWALTIVLISTCAVARTLDEYVTEAESLQQSGDLEQAVAVMEQAIGEYPDDATPYAYLGLYKGMQAGQAQAFVDAGRFTMESFEVLNKAVEMDPNHVPAHLFRGLMGVEVPEFMGLLDQGIQDLEFVANAYEKSPDEVPVDLAVTSYEYLSMAYMKKKDTGSTKQAWEKIIEIAPGTPGALAAAQEIAKLAVGTKPPKKSEFDGLPLEELEAKYESQPDNVDLLVSLGTAYSDAGNFAGAEKVLKKAIAIDPESAEAYKRLGLVLTMVMGGEGLYDERIHEDTDWATNLAFESMGYMDKAVELAPDDLDARLLNGIMAVNFPFFVGKLEQGLDNLQMVVDSYAPDSMKAEAAYWLGFGYQKKGMTYWIKVANEYSEETAARMVFAGMRPRVRRFDPSSYDKPVVVVNFLLGFRDELAPQTVIWIETEGGEFVRTLYISGFSGHAREVQVVLPVYASATDYAGADAATGASIDIGEHIYTWDLKDGSGNDVDPGRYIVKVETMYWPSMKYQIVEGPITVGESEDRFVIEEGDFIPYLELTYLP
jgi:tetratricopeptide (TPR) repeat protein